MTCDTFVLKSPGATVCKTCGESQAAHSRPTKVPPPAPKTPSAARIAGPPAKTPPGPPPPAKIVVHSPNSNSRSNITTNAPPAYDDSPNNTDDEAPPPDDEPPPDAESEADEPAFDSDVDEANLPEESPQNPWEEFKCGNVVIMVNLKTRAVRLESDDRLPAEENGEIIKPSKTLKVRRNSAIFEGAWTDDKKDRSPVDDEDDEYGPPSEDPDEEEFRRDSRVSDDRDLTLDGVSLVLKKIMGQCDKLLSIQGGSFLTDQRMDAFNRVRTKVEKIYSNLEDGKLVDDRNDVDSLLNLNAIKWDFHNELVEHYRATTKTRASPVFNDWYVPEYLSEAPLPASARSAQVFIKLLTRESSSSANKAETHLVVSITNKDTVGEAIEQALLKSGMHGDETPKYVLKSLGLAEYMRPARLFFSYAYVRTCMRNGDAIKCTLMKKPETEPLPSNEYDLAVQYKAKVNQNMQLIGEDSFKDITLTSHSRFTELPFLPFSELHIPFRVHLLGLDNVNNKSFPRMDDYNVETIFVECFLYYGEEKIPESICVTQDVGVSKQVRFSQWLMGGFSNQLLYDGLPRDTRIAWVVWGRYKAEKGAEQVLLGYVAKNLINHVGVLTAGPVDLPMWPFPAKKKGKHKAREIDPNFIFRATTRPNLSVREGHGRSGPVVLRTEFDVLPKPVVAPVCETWREPNPRVVGSEVPIKGLDKQQLKQYEQLVKEDPLYELTSEDKALIWATRHSLVNDPAVLPKFLQSTKWGNVHYRNEAHRLLKIWAPPFSIASVLELLDCKYHDFRVRQYAVNSLMRLKDDELSMYLLQLTQCLKFEPNHDSPLSRFMINRALRSPISIGQPFFWHLKAELHEPPFAERLGCILEEYLSHCGRFSAELRKQNNTVLKCQRVAAMVVRIKREEQAQDDVANKEYQQELHKLNAKFFEPQKKFQIPLDPRSEATTLVVEKCRFMSSKMVPLWLVFKNADPDAPPIILMFKSGDDLRQDILTLQVLRVMDKLWLREGLDMRLKPYNCIATGINEHGEGVGMIEIVLNSDTTSGIQLKYGGGAMGALKLDPIDSFLRDNNKDKDYTEAVDNFVASCAGYCVATFVLGIGDRHNGNIMVTKDGHLFHIDFGHFLGNFKKKFGVNRERAAFVFTPEMAFVMGGRKYRKHHLFKRFLSLCSKSFAILRQNAPIIENLFVLMTAAGMPELMLQKDVMYIKDKLHLDVNERTADKRLHDEINKSLDSTYRRFDNMIHNFKHG